MNTYFPYPYYNRHFSLDAYMDKDAVHRNERVEEQVTDDGPRGEPLLAAFRQYTYVGYSIRLSCPSVHPSIPRPVARCWL